MIGRDHQSVKSPVDRGPKTVDLARASSEAVRAALQHYADRGVFGGFSAAAGRGGTQQFRFTGLTREPMTLVFDPAAATLTLKELLPQVARGSAVLADVEELVASHASRAVPEHRRLDARRVRVACAHRRNAVSVVLEIKGRHHAYAVQRGVNLVNEIFTRLRESHPEYLWEAFGLPAE